MLSLLSLVLLAAASAASSGSDLPSSFQTPEPLARGKPPLRVQAPAGETSLPLLPQLGGAWPQAAEFFFEVAQPFADSVRVCVRRVGAAPDPCAAKVPRAAAAPKPRAGALRWRSGAVFEGPAARYEAVITAVDAVPLLAWGVAAEGAAPTPSPSLLGAPTPLPLNAPVIDSVGWGAWKYYELNVTNSDLRAAARLDISVVRTWGDPDL
jgi:hypothetical protein